MQFTIVESLIKSPKKIEEWELECKDQLALIKKSVDTAINKSTTIMRFNHARISKQLSLNNFSNEFGKVLSANRRPVKNPNGNRDDILRQFCSFERFRLLLAK
jgi:hypothetical protein